jgi:FKBP-type peptidyl-prolyl cis-trans isomerase FkpA
MNTKLLAGIVLVIIVIAGIVFFMSRGHANPSTSPQNGAADQVQGQDVTVGTGAEATPGSKVSVLYVGYLGSISTSTIFDSSAAHGNQPLTFTLGQEGLIPGFQIGVNGMKVGGERLLSIPASLGYGTNAVHQDPSNPNSPVIIPPNSTLIFDVKLVDVQASSTASAESASSTKH